MNNLEQDYSRYSSKKQMPRYQYHYRKFHESKHIIIKYYHAAMFRYHRKRYVCSFPLNISIDGGLFINHPYCITLNPDAVLGKRVSLHSGVTIGQENRGRRKGTPIIGNDVCICTNAVIVGKIRIGNDVLIAPNAYVNCDIPDHSIVIGNPCVIKHRENATEGYI